MASSNSTVTFENAASRASKTEETIEEPEWVLARRGINLILNNNIPEAEALFLKYPDSLVMRAGYSFHVFMDALMTFEEEKLAKAILVLKDVEKRCTSQHGWLKSISQKMFGSSNENPHSLAEQLETQIILADSQVCLAILTFLQQDLSAYFRGGWVLRKAWKVYQRTYKEILTLYKERIGELQLPDPITTPLTPTSTFEESGNESSGNESEDEALASDWEIPSDLQYNGASQVVDQKTIIRLMGAISVGYGLFQLGVSLLPTSLTKLISLLGFAANRANGIACLMYSRSGTDMRAPLASLSLLWYHTIVRPFYSIDGLNVQAGVEAATVLIQESQQEFGNSSLFLFFAGRTSRLDSDISAALTSFQKANDNANHREIKMLCLHEIGWCHLNELDYQNAKTTFLYLKQSSRWSKVFYGYLAAICIGALSDTSGFNIFDDLQKNSTKGGPLETFLTRRLNCCPKDGESAKNYVALYFKLLLYEMLYLWNTLATCSEEKIKQVIADCSNAYSPNCEPGKGLANLILGSCYSIQEDPKNAIDCFRKCLEERGNIACNGPDAHISAFAQYELGNILVQSQETREEGKTLLQQISKYNHYDFEARLNVRIHSVLRHLE